MNSKEKRGRKTRKRGKRRAEEEKRTAAGKPERDKSDKTKEKVPK